jgi:hypothetical protein
MTFGGKPSVQNYDIVGATIKELALTKCKIPAKLVHRQLDDVPVVAPEKTNWCQDFSATYTKLIPEKLENQHIICGVDCMGVVDSWENKKIKGDTCASILIKALLFIEAYLGSRIHMIHAPRRSDWVTESADNLLLIRRNTVSPKVITDWLLNPVEDWTLVDRLVDHVIARCRTEIHV